MSEVKRRVIATVMGREYVEPPATASVPQLSAGWWKTYHEEHDVTELPQTVLPIVSVDEVRVEGIAEPLSAADLGATEYSLALDKLAHSFERGGVLPAGEPVLVGEKPSCCINDWHSDCCGGGYPFLRSIDYSKRPPMASVVIGQAMCGDDKADRLIQYTEDVNNGIKEAVDEVLPDIRTFHFNIDTVNPELVAKHAEVIRKIVAVNTATTSAEPPAGKPDSIEVTTEDIEENTPAPKPAPVQSRCPWDPKERAKLGLPQLTATEGSSLFVQKVGRATRVMEIEDNEDITDVLSAYQKGLSVQAYRWIKVELEKIKRHCERVAIAEAKEAVNNLDKKIARQHRATAAGHMVSTL